MMFRLDLVHDDSNINAHGQGFPTTHKQFFLSCFTDSVYSSKVVQNFDFLFIIFREIFIVQPYPGITFRKKTAVAIFYIKKGVFLMPFQTNTSLISC